MLEHKALNPGTDAGSRIAGTSGTGVCIGIAVTSGTGVLNKSPDSHQQYMLEHQALNPGTDAGSGVAGGTGVGEVISKSANILFLFPIIKGQIQIQYI